MKKVAIIGLVGMMMFTAGCQTNVTGGQTLPEDGDSAVVSPIDSESKENTEVVSFESVDYRSFHDSAIIDKIENMRKESGHFAFVYKDEQYVAIFAGERESGGYTLQVDSVVREDGTVFVYANETVPSSDMMVTMALTYPLDVVKLVDFEVEETLEFASGISNISGETVSDEDNASPVDQLSVGDVIVVGEIMQFDGEYIHIIGGDIASVYEYDNANFVEFYVGQTVQLVKGEEKNELMPFVKEDYTIRHSNMGHIITQISGELLEVNGDEMIIKTDDGDMTVKSYKEIQFPTGSNVTAYTMNFGKGLTSIMMIAEESKLHLSVSEVERSEDGMMDLLLKDKDGGEYTMCLSCVSIEFDIASVVVGDELTVYHQGIMESWPMQLNTILVRK